MARPVSDLKERFLSKISIVQSGCWEWTARLDSHGYGRCYFNGKHIGAHRVSWFIFNKNFPNNTNVLHRCDNPKCVNPDHLFLGTQKDNMIDKINKNRGKFPGPTIPLKGENNKNHKLTNEEILEIRKIGKSMLQREIAEIYGICQTQVGRILNKVHWKESK